MAVEARIAAHAESRVLTYRDALYQCMRGALESHPNAIVLGQGVDDHKGIFGTTAGLAAEFGADRVMDVPLSEEGVTGIAIGAALGGLYPIQTHIRADFALLAMNQIVNLAAKYRYMFGGRFEVPMLVRMVIGRSWGQGAQHSQSIQALLAHVPGLLIVMPASAQSILESYRYAIEHHRGPVLSLEHRLLYDVQFNVESDGHSTASAFGSHRMREGTDVSVVATSIMAVEALRAAEHLEREAGISCEVIDLHCISHPDRKSVVESVAKTGRLIVADTSWRPFGVCAEVCRWIAEAEPSLLRAPVKTLGMEPSPCPTAKSLEDLFYPNLSSLCDAIAASVVGRSDHGVALPSPSSTTEDYRHFRGPF